MALERERERESRNLRKIEEKEGLYSKNRPLFICTTKLTQGRSVNDNANNILEMQNNRKSNSKKSILNAVSGITLIALVVTIVVLLILASVSITVIFGDNGILQLAKEAGEKTEKASEDEQNTILRYEYELAKLQGKISETETFGEYSMEKEIKEKYGQDIKIGDTVNYQDSVDEYNGTWKVLGIENGQILLMSSDPVNKNFTLKGKDDFLKLETKLNKECKKYGTGTGAESARSLKVEDINKITDYNPENPEKVEKYGKNTVAEYGTKVTFKLNEEGNLEYQCSNGQSLTTTDIKSFEHADGRILGDGISTITIENGGFEYLYGNSVVDFIKEGIDCSYRNALSDRMKNLFGSDGLQTPTGSENYTALANTAITTFTLMKDGHNFGAFFKFFQICFNLKRLWVLQCWYKRVIYFLWGRN